MKYFTDEELARTATGLPNTPPVEARASLRHLVRTVLDPLRAWLGEPIRVTSGYRSPAVNRAAGGAKDSQHLRGEAVDFVCRDMARAFAYIRAHLPYDQLIWEHGSDEQPSWIHVSLRYPIVTDQPNRRQTLRAWAGGRYTQM